MESHRRIRSDKNESFRITDARDASASIAARLGAVKFQLDNVVSWFEGQMSREESSGGSRGILSGSGRGPLYNSGRNVRDLVASFRDGIVTSWRGPIQKNLDDLKKSALNFDG